MIYIISAVPAASTK